MKTTINQRGAGHIVAVLAVLCLAIVGFAGFQVLNGNKASTTNTAATVYAPKPPKKITNKAELSQAGKVLDNSNSYLNSGLNADALDADLNDML